MKIRIDVDPRLHFEDILQQQVIPELVHLTGELNEENAAEFRRSLEIAECRAKQAEQEILPICIDSFGGEIYAMMACIDAMDACDLPLATIVEGKAMSAAAVIFSCGKEGYRFMGPHSTLMIHGASSFVEGKVDVMESEVEEVKRLNRAALERLAVNCNKPRRFFCDMVKKAGGAEKYLTAQECKRLGIANHLKIPTLSVTISAKNALEF